MDPTRIALFDLAEKRLNWTAQRQNVLASNIANVNTPNYQARDITPFDKVLSGTLAVAPVQTQAGHMAGTLPSGLASQTRDRAATRSLDRNGVTLDEQLVKVADTETTQNLVTNVWKTYMGMFSLALGKGGLIMANDLNTSLTISAGGMNAQTQRLRVIAQNIANQDTAGSSAGADPYQRRTITFETKLDQALGANTVAVKSIDKDPAAFPKRYDPSNPAADGQGYVKVPNVNSFIELMDMREAERSYSANLSVMQASRSMMNRTIDLLK